MFGSNNYHTAKNLMLIQNTYGQNIQIIQSEGIFNSVVKLTVSVKPAEMVGKSFMEVSTKSFIHTHKSFI